MKLLLTCLLFSLSAFQLSAAIYYVRDGGDGSAATTSWAGAYDQLTSAETAASRGDTIYVADGSYNAVTFNTAVSGTTLITIKKATASDHGTDTGWSSAYGDGQATFASPLQFTTDYWLFDGVVWEGFVLTCDGIAGSCPGCGSLYISSDNVTIKGVKFNGNYAAGFGHSLGLSTAGDTTIEYCHFYKSTYEDHIGGTPNGTLTLRRNVFQMPDVPADDAHRDIFNPYTGGGYNILFEKNICFNIWLFGFLLQDSSAIGDITIRYNVFSEFGHATFRLGSGNGGMGTALIYNNVFHNCKDQEIDNHTMKNNIFIRTDGWLDTFGDSQVHYSVDTAQYNMWVTGTTAGQSGTGNFTNATHNFVDTSSPLGADGIPFTADDGFKIQSGSAAIDKGVDVGLTTDIMGNAISGVPDVGAYEFQSGAPASYVRRITARQLIVRGHP